MAKKPEQPEQSISASRRGFFRQIMISAIEGLETVGRQLQENRRLSLEALEGSSYPSYHTPGYSPGSGWYPPKPVYGPPWPPTYGPPTPPAIRAALRAQAGRSVSQCPQDGSADQADQWMDDGD